MPERIQLKRTRGWRLPKGAVSVARPTRWGNPFVIGTFIKRSDPLRPFLEHAILDVDGVNVGSEDCFALIHPRNRTVAVRAYRLWLASQPDLIHRTRNELRGKDLACWC